MKRGFPWFLINEFTAVGFGIMALLASADGRYDRASTYATLAILFVILARTEMKS